MPIDLAEALLRKLCVSHHIRWAQVMVQVVEVSYALGHCFRLVVAENVDSFIDVVLLGSPDLVVFPITD